MVRALDPLKEYRLKTILAPALKAVECICELVIPFIVRAIIDNGLNPSGDHYHDNTYIFSLCFLVFGLSLLGFCSTMVTQYTASSVATQYGLKLRESIFAHIGELSPIQIESYGKSRVHNLINSSSANLQSGVQMFMRLLVRAPMLVIGSIIASFVVDVYAGLVVVAALLICSIATFIVAKVTPNRYRGLTDQLDELNKQTGDAVTGARVIRAFNRQKKGMDDFDSASEEYRHRGLGIAKINAIINPLTFGMVSLAVVLIIYLGSFARDLTGISVGSIVALISFLTQSMTALIQFTKLVTSMSKAIEANRRINEFFAIAPTIVGGQLAEGDKDSPIFELRHACVSYGGEAMALSNIDMEIKAGERIGIIGGTGSGKSTVISTLYRFIDPVEGEVLYKGHDIKEYQLDAFRQNLSGVSQKKQLFKGDIRFNLTLGKNIDVGFIDEALEKAQAKEFVYQKEGGLDGVVEDNGNNFSGGQKQRLLIARAILADKEVIILDDATSALDYKTDKLVRESLFADEDKTIIIVSQRATSVSSCDRIYVLDQGKVVGVGTHEALLKSCSIYSDIYETQVKKA